MRAGELFQRITIQQATEVLDAAGQATMTWATFGNGQIWAAVEPIVGSETWNAQEMQPDMTHRVRIRNFPGITSKMRVLYETRILNIRAVKDVLEADTENYLFCTEEV